MARRPGRPRLRRRQRAGRRASTPAPIEGALSQGRTVAVLGSGFGRHVSVGEPRLSPGRSPGGGRGVGVPPGDPPLAENFPVRNRIISGLALGLVVVEAARKSGSLITAQLALSQDREVMAVPGNVTSELSAGPNGLIQEGAKLGRVLGGRGRGPAVAAGGRFSLRGRGGKEEN
ncbi:MAG: DNA-protecting protein DprA [Desulfosudis oleivorans]|nr:DNA-protecting protein DprA [Desulfosudis oleivorans]